MALTLFCSRPHVKEVDFQTARFVVGTVRGLDVNGRHLERGEEVPSGGLSETALREEYDIPTRRIELLEYAFQDEALRTECLRHGVQPDPPEEEEVQAPIEEQGCFPPQEPSWSELVRLCKEKGLAHVGNTKQLRRRLGMPPLE